MSNNDLKTVLDKFEKVMKKEPDHKSSLPIFINFFRGFLRTRDPRHSLPSAEIISIIKKEKPTVFYFLKKQALQNPSLQLLTELEMDYDKAVERFNDLRSKL